MGLNSTLALPLTLNWRQRKSKVVNAILDLSQSQLASNLTPSFSSIEATALVVKAGRLPAPFQLQRQFQTLTTAARTYHQGLRVLATDIHLLWSMALRYWRSSLVMSSLEGISRSQLGGASGSFWESLGIFLGKPLPLNMLEKSVMSYSSSSTLFYFSPSSLETSMNLNLIASDCSQN